MLFVSTHTVSEWIPIVGDKNDIIVSVDKSSIKKTKNKVKLWMLYDYNVIRQTTEKISYLSTTIFTEIDCVEKTYILIEIYYFDKNESKGKSVHYINFIKEPDFINIRPNSSIEEVRKFVCKK